MHEISTTLGFIVGSRAYGEADKILSIFTKDYGLILATAQGLRLEKSKLRYHTQDLSLALFSFVRGRELWRLTNARIGDTVVSAGHPMIARVALLLKRLLHGEDPHPELFECIKKSINFINQNSTLKDEELLTLESVIVYRILLLLGYIGSDSSLDLSDKSPFTLGQLADLGTKRNIINQHINKALRESHL